MSQRLLLPLCSFSAAFVVAGACGGGSARDNGADAGSGSGSGVACGGHGQPACATDANDPEYLNHYGGEIRTEYSANPQTGAEGITMYAFFVSAQTPDSIAELQDGCQNTKSFVNTTNAGAVNTTRTFEDVGDTMTFTGAGEQPITLGRYSNIADKRGLVMGIEYAYNGSAVNEVPTTDVLRGAEYNIDMSGMGTFPGVLKMPTEWETVAGNLDFGSGSVNNIPAATDVTWQYSYVPGEPFVDTASLLFSGNSGSGVAEAWFCVAPINDGMVTIPAATVAMFPPSGKLQAATNAHQQINFNGRVVDVLGVTCRTTTYTIAQ